MNLIPLKNNCLQLLNEKISSYNQGFLAKASKPLQDVFKRLVQQSIDFLKEQKSTYEGHASLKQTTVNDITIFNENLMAILQYTCCAKTLPRAMQLASVETVQAYQALFLEDKLRLRYLQL